MIVTDPGVPNPRQIGRPRSELAHRAILDATLDVLMEEGIRAFSIEAVAARARVGKTTIYRRWPSKEHLIIAALARMSADLPFVDTGSLRDDLVALIRALLSLITTSRLARLMFQLAATMSDTPELFTLYQSQVIAPHLRLLAQRLERSIERRELRGDIDLAVSINLIIGPVVYYALVSADLFPASPALPEQLVEAILHGITQH